ncbi:zinc-ribbon domain-containing protein [Microbacterium sp. Mcb102]|uniref:zinc-ribbon domain-containing protein n=1 Tax=Microbacterium sp. Mcb102 TaxID=2926012 RepID=UPI0021C5B53E|nr:zinc-ribbon domain-containing protein [Microbacterium sp. Mcb102]
MASYLQRLRVANLVSDAAWGAWVAPVVRATGLTKPAALPLIVEAVAGLRPGHFERDHAALPHHPDGTRCGNCATGLDERFACVRCHPGQRVAQGSHDGPRVCAKHMMWVGPGTAPEQQHVVGVDALRADRMYRRLRRQGLLDAQRLAEVVGCLEVWEASSDVTLTSVSRFTLAVRLAKIALHPHAIDALASHDSDAAIRYSRLASDAERIVGTDDCIVLIDALWLLVRAAGHHDQDEPHAFVCTPKPENVDERAELEQLRSSFYPRGLHLHMSQFVSTDVAGTRQSRAKKGISNNYVCSRGHRFNQTLQQLRRVKKAVGCRVCANKEALQGFNSLADTHPHLSRFWHPSANGDLRPETVVAGSDTEVMWTCDEGHEYPMVILDKAKRNAGCSVCSNHRVDPRVNAFSVTHPAAAATWHPDRNGDLTPNDFTSGSSREMWWRCEEEGHDFPMTIYYRCRGDKCQVCTRKRAHPTTSFAATHPRAASRWHPTKNGTVLASDVLFGTKKKYWFLCEEEGHHYEAPVITQSRGGGCNICTGRVVDEQNCMRTLRPDLAREFHPTANGSLTPDNTYASTYKKIIWVCEHGHDWSATGLNRAKGTGCPFCANFSCWTGWNDMATTRPDLAADWDWDMNGELDPTTVMAGTGKRIAWKCATCSHRWPARGNDRVRGSGCPECFRTKPRRRQR